MAGEAEESVDRDVWCEGDAEAHEKLSSSVARLGNRRNAARQKEIGEETHQETYEPGVVVQTAQGRKHQAKEGDGGAGSERRDGGPIEAAPIFVLAIALVEIFDEQMLFADDEVIADKHASDRAEKTGVADEPSENVTS